MTVTLYGLKGCDTCKKALKALELAGKSAEFIDIRTETDLTMKVPLWLDAAGIKLLNKASTTWRGLPETDKQSGQTNPAPLLMANPTLIKRPVIEADGVVYVGWKKDVQDALL
ncbi:MAG: ArsC/Spx/MgsR family protein [Pseudomonadota bacterium]